MEGGERAAEWLNSLIPFNKVIMVPFQTHPSGFMGKLCPREGVIYKSQEVEMQGYSYIKRW